MASLDPASLRSNHDLGSSILPPFTSSMFNSFSHVASSTALYGAPAAQWAQERASQRASSIQQAASAVSKVVGWGEIELRDKLGEGAFGEVFAADYGHTRCAIKRLAVQATAEMAENLKSEFDLMMQLRHPYVLQMIAFCSDGDQNCGILMELMEANLNDVMNKKEFAEYNSWEGSLLSIATDTSLGMGYLHQQSVL